MQSLIEKLLKKDPSERPDANTLLGMPEVKKYLPAVISLVEAYDIDAA